MEPKELDWPAIIQAIAAAVISIYMVVIANRQKAQAEESKEIKHLVNSTQTNLQTSIDDLRVENQGLRQDKADSRADSVQQVEVVTDSGPVEVKNVDPDS